MKRICFLIAMCASLLTANSFACEGYSSCYSSGCDTNCYSNGCFNSGSCYSGGCYNFTPQFYSNSRPIYYSNGCQNGSCNIAFQRQTTKIVQKTIKTEKVPLPSLTQESY